MGILHKLVFILGKLDPRNDQWRQRQIAKVENLIDMAEEIDDSTVRRNTLRDLEQEIHNINEAFERNELDYGRKLYLIENCIYGVDIQPIAVQIAKLRFFISLVVDQRIDDTQENRGGAASAEFRNQVCSRKHTHRCGETDTTVNAESRN